MLELPVNSGKVLQNMLPREKAQWSHWNLFINQFWSAILVAQWHVGEQWNTKKLEQFITEKGDRNAAYFDVLQSCTLKIEASPATSSVTTFHLKRGEVVGFFFDSSYPVRVSDSAKNLADVQKDVRQGETKYMHVHPPDSLDLEFILSADEGHPMCSRCAHSTTTEGRGEQTGTIVKRYKVTIVKRYWAIEDLDNRGESGSGDAAERRASQRSVPPGVWFYY